VAPYQQRLAALNKAHERLASAASALRHGELQAALASLESQADGPAPLAQADYLLVRTHLRQGDAPAALAAAQRLAGKRPDDPEALFLLGLALRVSGDSDAAADTFERMLVPAPGDTRPHH